MLHTVSDFNIKMNKSALKRKGGSSAIEPYDKCITNNERFNFQNLCKEVTRQQIDVLKLGKLLKKKLTALKIILKVQNIFI